MRVLCLEEARVRQRFLAPHLVNDMKEFKKP